MAHRPVGSGVSFTTSTTSSKSSAISGRSNALRVVATGANAFVAIGTEPTATTGDYCVPAGTSATLAIDNGSARIVGVTTGTTTYVTFPEGQASPFGIGDYVTLTVSNQTYYNFTHAPVIQVFNTSNYEGYFSTRIGIATDTSGIATAFSDPDAVLRNSFKVAAITDSGSGVLYTQQVQISGQA
jgi:hypothetical protein